MQTSVPLKTTGKGETGSELRVICHLTLSYFTLLKKYSKIK